MNDTPTDATKTAHIQYSTKEHVWYLYVDGAKVLKSSDRANGKRTLINTIEKRTNDKLRALNVTQYVVVEKEDEVPNKKLDAEVLKNLFASTAPATTDKADADSISAQLNSMFSANERFEFLTNAVMAAAYQVHDFGDPTLKLAANPLAILCGSGGIGKSFSTKQTLDSLGLMRTELDSAELEFDADEFKTADEKGCRYVIIGGYTTAKALYRALYNFRSGAVIVLDDCDAAMKDTNSIELLKNACDSSAVRRVSWNSEMRQGDDLPRSFEFRSSVVVITNLPMGKIPQPLRSRARTADVTLKRDEVVDRIEYLVYNSNNFLPDFSMDIKMQVLGWFKEAANSKDMLKLVPNLNLRCFRQAAAAYVMHKGENTWVREALYNMASANT